MAAGDAYGLVDPETTAAGVNETVDYRPTSGVHVKINHFYHQNSGGTNAYSYAYYRDFGAGTDSAFAGYYNSGGSFINGLNGSTERRDFIYYFSNTHGFRFGLKNTSSGTETHLTVLNGIQTK